ncbi:hypothetical protein AWB68_03278 [Caballeronia choica]|jgi:hypothetical protein|uniref:Uncharacterized protein n=1 Tax=Caballeronia choica TaxID=326476 RepID=A0A158J0C7_9BURK|nr:hypothetical protein [Caballeronia choica]SAL62308.1 hypothetical protein AWB68_03278 [Caballeronia choica]
MNCVDQASTDSLLPVSGGWHCRSMQGFIMLMAHGRTANAAPHLGSGRATTESWRGSLPTDVARAFESQTGYATSAIALTAAVDDKLELARFLAVDGSAAAVLVMDAQVLSHVWPLRDWKTPLLRVHNRLADEGSKFFVALTTRHEKGGVTGVFTRLRERLIALRVRRYCEREGVGFLGAVQTTPPMASARDSHLLHERVGTVIAHRLASTTFFCCDAFRTGATAVNTLSQMRG